MAIAKLDKLPKRKVTVDELLLNDDIRGILRPIFEKRGEIDQLLAIYTDKEGVVHSYWQGTRERIIYALEITKYRIMEEALHEEAD